MNLEDWRKNGERRSLALDMLKQPILREMLAILEFAEHPARRANWAQDGFGATKALGRIEGYQEAIDKLRSFAEPIPLPPETIPVTWGTDSPPELPKK